LVAQRRVLPSVVTAAMHRHDLAHAQNAVLVFMALDERVLHPDCLAKYVAAFFRMSRSSVTRLSSAFRRRSSSACDNWAACWPGGIWWARSQLYRLWALTPNLLATSAAECPRSVTCLTASSLNSGV